MVSFETVQVVEMWYSLYVLVQAHVDIYINTHNVYVCGFWGWYHYKNNRQYELVNVLYAVVFPLVLKLAVI